MLTQWYQSPFAVALDTRSVIPRSFSFFDRRLLGLVSPSMRPRPCTVLPSSFVQSLALPDRTPSCRSHPSTRHWPQLPGPKTSPLGSAIDELPEPPVGALLVVLMILSVDAPATAVFEIVDWVERGCGVVPIWEIGSCSGLRWTHS